MQIVAPRSIIACAKSPLRASGRDAVGERPDPRPRAGQRRGKREQARDDPLDIGVDHDGALIERDRGDRGGGVGADAGQGAQLGLGGGEKAVMLGRDLARAGDQVARAGIIAKPRPGGHHLALVGGGERLDTSASAW